MVRPAVELHDEASLAPEAVHLDAGDDDVDLRARQPCAVDQVEEHPLELGASWRRLAVGGQCRPEAFGALMSRISAEAALDVGKVEDAATPCCRSANRVISASSGRFGRAS